MIIRRLITHLFAQVVTGEGAFCSWRVGYGTHSGETERSDGGPWPQRMRRHSPKLEYQQMAAIVYVSRSPT